MSQSSITSLMGVYRLPITDGLIESASWSPGTSLDHRRSFLSKVVLVVVLVENASPEFNPFEIKQASTSPMLRSFFDYTFLSADGLRELAPSGCELPPDNSVVRVAIYLRDFRDDEPILTPDGQIEDFVVTEMPDHLRILAPYFDD